MVEVISFAAGKIKDITLEVTPIAAGKIKDIMKEQGDLETAVRVIVVGMNCSGPQYMMAFDKEVKGDDTVMNVDGVRLIADPDTLEVLAGARIDYVDELMHQGFTIINPNAEAGGCGAGCSCGGHH